MSYNKGQGSFGSTRGNIWASLRQLIEGQGSINPSDQSGGGGAQLVKATYDFAVDGGGIGTIQLANSLVIPTGAIIFGGLIDGITLPVGVGATIAVGLGAGAQAASLKAATAIATYAAGAIVPIVPVWTAASAFVVAADTKVSVTIATAALTAGKFGINLYYHMRGE
jgi:hypothetical protein